MTMKLDIQSGDKVILLPATVDTVYSDGSMRVYWENDDTVFAITQDKIEKVVRPLVLHVGGTAMTVYGSKMVEVRGIEGNYAWVKFPDGSYTTRFTHELTPLD